MYNMKVKFTAKYENKEDGLKAYEFETPDYIQNDIDGYSTDIFRLDCLKGEWMILEQMSDAPYMVSEDVTHLFDLEDIIKQMQDVESEIPCEQTEYNEWWEEEGQYE
ncbi:hypothetical protein PP654_gp030 [Bacillus phage v_B-Bak10]|uniref:Uncharacterized protein n=1 Tax=Bacillus phage v_B-Bak10 TaxID=2094736 RepID=A0A385IK81_9CAUD|nr:hypothetical protein PP654_gp030 [Bacillus phage v_B-Bak10]AXY83270.1 hypothetical protein vBBBak10_112 [Bacillus phage v_B-Bak10]